MTRADKYRSLFFLSLAIMTLSSCSVPDFSPEYAIAKLELPNGKAIYFKREVRGINGNYDVVAISPNSDPCTSVDSDCDYCICYLREFVYYKLEGDTLHLYYATAGDPPAKNFPVKVVNHEINIMKVEEFKRNYSSQGITRLELVVDGTKRCG
jgi:hypothetical protein